MEEELRICVESEEGDEKPEVGHGIRWMWSYGVSALHDSALLDQWYTLGLLLHILSLNI